MNATEVKISHHRCSMVLNIVALTILFVGYLLTTGTGLFDSDGSKAIFRFSSLLVLIVNLIIDGSIKKRFLLAILILISLTLLNQSPLTVNIIFLILIAASMYRLNTKELAISLLIPVATVVVLHALLLSTGKISIEILEIGDRTRTSFGFSNANQISVVYLSLVLVSVFAHIAFKRKFSFLIMIASFLLAFAILLETDSRTSLFGLILIFFANIFSSFLIKFRSYRLFSYCAGFFAPIFGIAVTIYIINSVGTELDLILSLRPYFFSEFIGAASAIDMMLGWSDQSNPPVDNLFLTTLSAVGVIGFFVIIFIVSIRSFKMRVEFIPLVIIMMVLSIFESFLLRPEIPGSVLFVTMLFSPLMQRLKLENNKR